MHIGCSWQGQISASSTVVENDAIDENTASSHVGKICHSYSAILVWLPGEIWRPMINPVPRYKSRILANFALSTGVENDTIKEADATALHWWLNRADWGVGMHIGYEWQRQISSTLVCRRHESWWIYLCQQVWRMMLLMRIIPWATWFKFGSAMSLY